MFGESYPFRICAFAGAHCIRPKLRGFRDVAAIVCTAFNAVVYRAYAIRPYNFRKTKFGYSFRNTPKTIFHVIRLCQLICLSTIYRATNCTAVGAYGIRPGLRGFRDVAAMVCGTVNAVVYRAYAIRPYNFRKTKFGYFFRNAPKTIFHVIRLCQLICLSTLYRAKKICKLYVCKDTKAYRLTQFIIFSYYCTCFSEPAHIAEVLAMR